MVEDALVVLRGSERDRGLAVGQCEKTDLAAGQEFLDHDFGAGRAEPALEHHGNGGFGLSRCHCDHDALARRKPVGLDHDRCALRANVSQRVGRIGETPIGTGRNAEFGAERLGKSLGAFELRSLLARPERLDAGGREVVDNAGHQRRFRADHDEIHGITSAKINHRPVVGDIERDAFGLLCDAGIARRAPELCHQSGSRDLPRQSVFAAAGPEQKDVHEMARRGCVKPCRSHEFPSSRKGIFPAVDTGFDAFGIAPD